METRHFKIKKIYVIIFIVALVIKFLLLALPGHYGDLFLHQKWGNFLINHSPTEIYHQTECNLPPFWVYILWFFSHLHYLITGSQIFLISEVLKIPGVLADIAIGLIIFYFLLKNGVKEKIALLASLFFIINPFVVYNSSVWGQLDSLYALFLLLAFVFLAGKRLSLGVVTLAVSCLIKLQGFIFLPLFFFILWGKYPWKKIIKLFFIYLAAAFLITLPFIIGGNSPAFIFQKTWQVAWHQSPYFTLNAFNLWWLPQVIFFHYYTPSTHGSFFADQITFVEPLSFKTIGLILFALFYLLIFLNRKKNIFLLASLVSLMFFMLPTAMHERYIFPFFAFFSIFWAMNWSKEKNYLFIYLLISLFSFLNLLYAIVNDMVTKIRIDIYLISPALALINVLLFFFLFFKLIKKDEANSNCPANL